MSSFKKILIATDFSNAAKNATDYVIQLLKSDSCVFTLLHTYEIPYSELQDVIQIHDLLKTNATTALNNEADRISQHYPLVKKNINIATYMGDLVNTIKRISYPEKIDLIVLGSHSDKSSIEQIIFGSTVYNILKDINIPVLIVPEKCPFKGINKILFATDYQELNNSSKALFPLIHIAEITHSEITLFNVLQGKKEQTKEEKKTKQDFEKHLAHIPHAYKSIRNSNISEDIITVTKNSKFDMVCTIPRNHNFIDRLIYKNVTQSIAKKINIPLLAINENI